MLSEVTDSCLFLSPNGNLIEVFCEFQVIALRDVHRLSQGDIVQVASVRYDAEGRIIFLIEGEYYFAHHFCLVV